MTKVLPSLLLTVQLLLAEAAPPALSETSAHPAQENRLMWGLIDPELSAWFALLPAEDTEEDGVLWDWTWQGFLAALFGCPVWKEVPADGAHL